VVLLAPQVAGSLTILLLFVGCAKDTVYLSPLPTDNPGMNRRSLKQ
jgi:hypothetical protein